jgi:flavin-dependent thymidylate synthase
MTNTVQLLGHYGSDEIIACSAWTSTSRELTEEKRARIPTLIEMLWKEGHHTPFEKGVVHFLVDCDIASHIHLLKHRISSMNAESARYKALKDGRFYVPPEWEHITADTNDLFSQTPQGPLSWADVLMAHNRVSDKLYQDCLEQLTPVLGRKRAKETARYFRPYNSQIQCDISFNMRSFANFQNLRNDTHAQREIMTIAQLMLTAVRDIEGGPFEHTLNMMDKYKQRMVQQSTL